jgi:DNA-binding transcriptional MerR regulator
VSRTFSAEDEETLRQLHADGVSRNEIARQMEWSVGTITNHAQHLGLSFDREAVRAATDARQVDLKERRQRIQEQLLGLAERAIERAQSRYMMHGWTHTGESVAEWLQQPPAKETKDLTLAASSALTSALKLAQVDAGDEGRENARGLLATLGEAMTTAARELGGDDADEYGS